MARLDFAAQEFLAGEVHGGTPDALFQLGLMYCTGREVALDLVAAHKWFNISAMRGNHDAKLYRTEIASEMTKAQISAAQKSAREWLKHN